MEEWVDAGIKLGGVVADIDGVSARRRVEGLIAGKSPAELATLGLGPLKDKREALEASMESELSPRHFSSPAPDGSSGGRVAYFG